jgi:histidine triad (HIT) family protein
MDDQPVQACKLHRFYRRGEPMNPENCVFCKIVQRSAPANILYQDEYATAFTDAHPAAPVHILIVPNLHIASMNDLLPEHEPVMGHLLTTASKLAKEFGLAERGYRLIINTGHEGGQSVYHLHIHLMGGSFMPSRSM